MCVDAGDLYTWGSRPPSIMCAVLYCLCFPQSLPHADVIYFCSPNNPTGAVATRAQLEALVAHAKEKVSAPDVSTRSLAEGKESHVVSNSILCRVICPLDVCCVWLDNIRRLKLPGGKGKLLFHRAPAFKNLRTLLCNN